MTLERKQLGIGIVGCGLVGKKRAHALGVGGRLVACADRNLHHASMLAKEASAKIFNDWHALIEYSEVDAVIVSTLHDSLAQITLAAIQANKPVLVEKPAARTPAELKPVMDAAAKQGVVVRVGFNHRYHLAIRQAKELVDSGELGALMYLRARYGHGGRLGYETEWRANPMISGGGELIDQGPHLIDLSRWFLGDFTSVQGFAHTYYWDMPVDDNGFMLLKTKAQQVAFLQVSCTEWKNLFSMEIYGRQGKLELSGLGGSYGLEKLTHYRMLPEMGPPQTTTWEFLLDESWALELAEFYEDIHLKRTPSAGLHDAYAALNVIQTIYKESGYDPCS